MIYQVLYNTLPPRSHTAPWATQSKVLWGLLQELYQAQPPPPFCRMKVSSSHAHFCEAPPVACVWTSVLQCVAVCCSVLQCVAVCCSVLQCVAVCCIVAGYIVSSHSWMCAMTHAWVMAHSCDTSCVRHVLQCRPMRTSVKPHLLRVSRHTCRTFMNKSCHTFMNEHHTLCAHCVCEARAYMSRVKHSATVRCVMFVYVAMTHAWVMAHSCDISIHTATYTNASRRDATHRSDMSNTRRQHTAAHCNTLQHTATHCNTLQHTATHCNTCLTQDVSQLCAMTHAWVMAHIHEWVASHCVHEAHVWTPFINEWRPICGYFVHESWHTFMNESQHVCVCCSVNTLQHTATHTRMAHIHEWVATCLCVLQCVASRHVWLCCSVNTLQHIATHCNTHKQWVAACLCVLQCERTATHCNTLQNTQTMCCVLLVCVAVWTHCNTLQHTQTWRTFMNKSRHTVCVKPH